VFWYSVKQNNLAEIANNNGVACLHSFTIVQANELQKDRLGS